MNRLFGFFLLFFFCCQQIFALTRDKETFKFCSNVSVSEEHTIAYIGWRYKLLCDLILNEDTDSVYDYYLNDPSVNASCKIWNENGTLLFENSTTLLEMEDEKIGFLLPADNRGTNFTIDLIFPGDTSCYTLNVHLNLIQLQQQTCKDFEEKKIQHFITPTKLESKQHRFCKLDPTIYPKIYDDSNIAYYWQKNCSTPFQTKINKNEFKIRSVTYEDAGIYTCFAIYNGMRRYVTSYAICVEEPITLNPPTLTCEKPVIYQNVGKDAVFQCFGNFGFGQIKETDFKFSWKKKLNSAMNSTSSQFVNCEEYDSRKKSDITCTYRMVKKPCLLHVASDAERKSPEAIIPLQLIISNIKQEDYGGYVISVTTNVEKSKRVNKCVSLEPNPLPGLFTQAQLAGVLVGIFGVFLILFFVVLYNKIYFQVYYKRYFGKFVVDDKLYGAYFVYHFSQDMSSSSIDYVNLSVSAIQKQLTNMKYNVLDEKRDGCLGQSRVEGVQTSITNSHRIIILLTLDFIKDEWSMLALQKGFNEMIKAKSKLIFILFPGIKEYLLQHAKSNKTCLMIKRAIQNNYSIQWVGLRETPKKRFKMELENAMPKLKPHVNSSNTSKSSSDVKEPMI